MDDSHLCHVTCHACRCGGSERSTTQRGTPGGVRWQAPCTRWRSSFTWTRPTSSGEQDSRLIRLQGLSTRSCACKTAEQDKTSSAAGDLAHGPDALHHGRRLAVLGLTDQQLHQRTSHQSYAEAVHALEMQVSLNRTPQQY